MIYYNSNTINDWNFGDDNIIKVYRNNAVCYYKITGGDTPTPVQEPCFAVVDDISQYSDTEFEDVFNKADNKWYKLNNLNQYEEYGIYGSGRTITTYDGKLTVDDGYEYMYSGGSWVNVGEVSGSSITIKSPEYISKTSSASNGRLDLGYSLKDNTRFQIKVKPTYSGGGLVLGQYNATSDNNDYRIFWYSNSLYYDYGSNRKKISQAINNTYEYEVGNYYVKNLATSANVLTGTTKSGVATSMDRKISLWDTGSTNDRAEIYYTKIYEGDTLIRDFIPWTDMNGNYGMFDKVSMSVFNSTNQLTGSSNVTDVEVSRGYEYPLEYVVREDPPDNLVFSTMTEAEAYECPWVGMKATIDGDKYIFSGDSQSGYEWVYNPSRLPAGYTEVEYVESTGNTGLNLQTTANQDTRMVAVMQATTITSGRLWGCGGYDRTPNGWQFNYEQNMLKISWGTVAGWTTYNNCTADTDVHEYDWDKNYFYRDKGTANEFSASIAFGNFQTTDPIGLFCNYQQSYGGFENYWKGKCFSCQVYDNGTLIRDLVPCTRDNDSKAGMYDIVNDVFYYPPSYKADLVAGNPV